MSDGDVSSQPVIDWSEAMQQCGDDEEFLRELLVDLRTEAETQLTNIQSIIQVITMERKLKKTMQFERQETTRPSFFFQFSHVDFFFFIVFFYFHYYSIFTVPSPEPVRRHYAQRPHAQGRQRQSHVSPAPLGQLEIGRSRPSSPATTSPNGLSRSPTGHSKFNCALAKSWVVEKQKILLSETRQNQYQEGTNNIIL